MWHTLRHFTSSPPVSSVLLYEAVALSIVRVSIRHAPVTGMAAEPAQAQSGHHSVSDRTIATDNHQMGQASGRWEGSPEGTAFSEFNHRFAGLCDVVFGLAESGYALQYPLPQWTRLVLPGALGIVGIGAALAKGLACWFSGISPCVTKRWEVAWAGCVILFGLLLLVYSQ